MIQIFKVLEEQHILRTTKTKPIVDAIKNRKKISFFYSGPRKPSKDSVKQGNRVDVEPVALGLSKKGNLIIRAFVQPPSVSKKGFGKTGWRTFIVGRMSNLRVSDEKFDQKRPDYKEGDDSSMTVTYVTSDWTNKPDVKKPRIIKPTPTEPKPTEPEVKPTEPTPSEPTPTEPEMEPTKPEEPKTTELPQPKPEEKPEVPSKEPTEPEVGQEELPQPKPEEKPSASPEGEEDEVLKESIRKIKHLMFF